MIVVYFLYRRTGVTTTSRIGATGSKRGSTIDDLSTVHGSSLDDSLESNNGSNDTNSLGKQNQ